MKTVKKIKVPFIEGLESLNMQQLDLAMEKSAAKFAVCENNWAREYPYAPDCNGAIAYSRSHLAVIFHVRGLDLRATVMKDNGHSWEDSCCEFFVTDPYDGTYYNFEMTAIGSILSSKRTSRMNSMQREDSEIARIIRFSTLEHKAWNERDRIFAWSVAMLIPFDLIGIDRDNIPVSVMGNFYKCGDKTAHPHFLSWNPVGTPKPDFHRPEYFGEFILR